jgi:hypothetical protein
MTPLMKNFRLLLTAVFAFGSPFWAFAQNHGSAMSDWSPNSNLQLNMRVVGAASRFGQVGTAPSRPASYKRHQKSGERVKVDQLSAVEQARTVPEGAPPPPTTLPLNNGNFETPPFMTVGTVTDWIVGGPGDIADIDEGATSCINSAAFSAGDDSEGNTLSQSFNTVVNQTYKLDFDAAVYGIPDPGATLQLRAQVTGGSSLVDQTETPLVSGSFVKSAVPWTHYQYTFTADSTVTTLQFSDIGMGNQFADVVVDTVSVVPTPPTFAQWQALHFTPAELSNPNISGWSADPDKDGIANGFEYFFQTGPKTGILFAEKDWLPRVAIEVSDSFRYLTLTYRRLVCWPGNPEVIGVSDNLVAWDETEDQIEQLTCSTQIIDDSTELVTFRLKTPINQGPIPRKFLRLKLTE